jgi:monoamine oxidase
MSRTYDVVVVGAGAAGLAAAAELARRGKSALVLEARKRVGGRVWTLDVAGLPVPVELGAEFIHGRPEATFSLLRQAGIAALERTGDGWYGRGGKLERMGEIFAEIRAAIRQARLPRQDVSFEAFLARDLLRLSARARAFARRRVEGYDAADPSRASARAILEEWLGEDDAAAASHYRPAGGYGALMTALAAQQRGASRALAARPSRDRRDDLEGGRQKAEG